MPAGRRSQRPDQIARSADRTPQGWRCFRYIQQIGGVKQIEDFAEQHQTHNLSAEQKAATQSQVLCEEAVVEIVIRGQGDMRGDLAAEGLLAGKVLIVAID